MLKTVDHMLLVRMNTVLRLTLKRAASAFKVISLNRSLHNHNHTKLCQDRHAALFSYLNFTWDIIHY